MRSGVAIRSLCKIYGSGKKAVAALEDVDFDAEPGRVTILLGPNGAGKSTLLCCIAGILVPTSGDICVCGEREPGSIRAVSGYVGETHLPDRALTVAECLAFEAALPHSGGQESAQRAVRLAGLDGVLGKTCGTLSKGYVQRLALAQAVCRNPGVLVLDEFSDGLDPAQTVTIRSALKELAADRTVIVSTHRISEARELGGRIWILGNGRIICSGEPDEILRKTGKDTLEEAFLSLTAKEK